MANAMKQIFGGTLRREGDDQSMRDICAHDFKRFCEYYLADSFKSEWSEKFHLWLIHKVEDVVLNHSDEETRNVVAAPRGHAKSTLISFAFVIWCICYGYKHFIVIISATGPVAKQFIIDIRNELEFNERIKNDFGEMKNDDIWNSNEIYTRNKVFLTSKGAGAQMRGMKFNSTRPDLVILDDLETAEQVASPSQNASLKQWFNSDVMPMGCPTCSFFYIGTVLSYDALLYHMLNDGEYSSWVRKTFQAVIKFSDSPLWAEWETIMTDLTRGDHAYSDALAFYREHKEEMLRGTEVLWPNQRADMYEHLMERRIASEEGFASEFQNDPQTENTRTFKTEWLENNRYIDCPEIKEICIAIDPAIGGKRANDFSAIIAVARCVDNYFYVLDADLKKRRPEEIIEDAKAIIARYYSYNPKIVCETNQMQLFFSSTLQRELVQAGIYLEWIDVCHTNGDSKVTRIESLVPHVRQGHIKFKAGQKILLSQLRNYPKGHDDGPDCLEMALKPLLETSVANFSFGSIDAGGVKMNMNRNRMGNSPFGFFR